MSESVDGTKYNIKHRRNKNYKSSTKRKPSIYGNLLGSLVVINKGARSNI